MEIFFDAFDACLRSEYLMIFLVAFFTDVIYNLIILKFLDRYVGNLDPSVTEELIVVLFGQIGTVKGCKIIHEVKLRFTFPFII